MNFKKLLPVLFFILLMSSQFFSQSLHKVYLIKTSWHVGITFHTDSVSVTELEILNYFRNYKYVDIGWGDADFYQNPGFNILLGLKAIILPTESVIRISGILSDLQYFIDVSDFTVELNLTHKQFRKLLTFVRNSLFKDSNGNYVIGSEHNNGRVIFFKSNLKYHLLHTCNTWIAETLNFAGLKIKKKGIITAQQLYRELIKIGKPVKIPE